MGVELVRDDEVADVIRGLFSSRGRAMPDNNLRQADVPVGATVIEQRTGTAPGLICPVGDGVVYAVPGVPYEMKEMLERAVLPDLATRAGVRQVIASRVLRTWGESESPRRRAPRSPAAGARRHRHGHDRVPRQRHRGHQGAPHRTRRQRGARQGAARRRGGRGARRARRHRVQRRGPPDGGRGRSAAGGAGPHARHRRVAHRRAGGVAGRERPRIERLVQGRRGRLRQPGEVRRPRRARGAGRQRGRRQGDGRRRAPRPAAPTSASPPPAWPAPPSRRASRRAPCGWAWPWATRSRRGSCASPATATGSASSA